MKNRETSQMKSRTYHTSTNFSEFSQIFWQTLFLKNLLNVNSFFHFPRKCRILTFCLTFTKWPYPIYLHWTFWSPYSAIFNFFFIFKPLKYLIIIFDILIGDHILVYFTFFTFKPPKYLIFICIRPYLLLIIAISE